MDETVNNRDSDGRHSINVVISLISNNIMLPYYFPLLLNINFPIIAI